jgi:hypothetical protein
MIGVDPVSERHELRQVTQLGDAFRIGLLKTEKVERQHATSREYATIAFL